MIERLKKLAINTHVVDERENSSLRVENGKGANGRREKWPENHNHVVIFAVHVCRKSES